MSYDSNLAYKNEYNNYKNRTARGVRGGGRRSAYENTYTKTGKTENLQHTDSDKPKPVSDMKRMSRSGKIKRIIVASILIVIAGAAAAFMITQYVSLDALDRQVKSLSKEVEALRSSNDQKLIEMDQGLDLDYIEEQAEKKLDMHRPERYQQIYVDVPRDDETTTTADEAESLSTRFGEFVDNIKSAIVDKFSIR